MTLDHFPLDHRPCTLSKWMLNQNCVNHPKECERRNRTMLAASEEAPRQRNPTKVRPRYSGRKNAIFSRWDFPPLSISLASSLPSFFLPPSLQLARLNVYVRRRTHFAVPRSPRPRPPPPSPLRDLAVQFTFIGVDATSLSLLARRANRRMPPNVAVFVSAAILAWGPLARSATWEISPSSPSSSRNRLSVRDSLAERPRSRPSQPLRFNPLQKLHEGPSFSMAWRRRTSPPSSCVARVVVPPSFCRCL